MDPETHEEETGQGEPTIENANEDDERAEDAEVSTAVSIQR